jgi:hypothetical protein
LDNSSGETLSLWSDQKNPDGVFQNLKFAYTLRDTSHYDELFDQNFTFVYRDYDRGVDVSWGKDEEMRTAYGLFQNVQQLDLKWNDVITSSFNSDSTEASISRGFNLTVIFNPSDIVHVDGYADLQLGRQLAQDPWTIVRWRDESNF